MEAGVSTPMTTMTVMTLYSIIRKSRPTSLTTITFRSQLHYSEAIQINFVGNALILGDVADLSVCFYVLHYAKNRLLRAEKTPIVNICSSFSHVVCYVLVSFELVALIFSSSSIRL